MSRSALGAMDSSTLPRRPQDRATRKWGAMGYLRVQVWGLGGLGGFGVWRLLFSSLVLASGILDLASHMNSNSR